MYIRVKRKNQTIFLYTDQTEKIADVKGKIAKINEHPADQLALIFNDHRLEDDKTVADAKIENDNIVFLVYKKEGSNDFEEVDIQKTKTEGEGSSEKKE
jgi:hypothetical protein